MEDSLIINHSKFRDSNLNSLAPSTGQICTHVSANNFWTVRSKSKIIFSSDFLAWMHAKSPIRTGLVLPGDLQSFVIIAEVVCDLNPVRIGHVCNM